MDTEYPIRTLPTEEFPSLLREIPDPPKTLFFRGNTHILNADRLLAVVGSRAYTQYGARVTQSLIEGLRGYPITIVSGLALGIDGLVHRAALTADLPTVAIPGSGLDESVLYPRSHRTLARTILDHNGLLLSEFPVLERAATWTFPKRNRIMAGISHATLIIEANEKSGTLITARLAMEYNRDVLVVPGSIFSENSIGPHALLRDGATPITSSSDILEALGFRRDLPPLTHDRYSECSDTERKILEILREPKAKDEIIRILNIHIHDANILLSLMELKGFIIEIEGKMQRTLT